jgi:hypothetical protein
MLHKELVKDIIDEVTFSGALPYKIPDKEVDRVITNAKNYFYDYWRYALQKKNLVIPKSVFQHPSFATHRGIVLPDCVKYVHDLKELKGNSIFGSIDRDLGDQKFVGSELFMTPFIGESLVYRVAMFSFLDITKNLTLDTIAFDYNHSTHFLQILGRTPRVDVYMMVSKKIDDAYLYENELFQRYVRAKAKIRTNEMLSFMGDFQLPGSFKLNYSAIAKGAEDELAEIKKTIEEENTPDFIFMEHY